jgi:hypothetical protein
MSLAYAIAFKRKKGLAMQITVNLERDDTAALLRVLRRALAARDAADEVFKGAAYPVRG